jgi:hypothetical protein
MAAILMKNDAEMKAPALPDGVKFSNFTACIAEGCKVTYTLAYGAVENRMENGVNVRDILMTRATEIVHEGHPGHADETYVWGGTPRLANARRSEGCGNLAGLLVVAFHPRLDVGSCFVGGSLLVVRGESLLRLTVLHPVHRENFLGLPIHQSVVCHAVVSHEACLEITPVSRGIVIRNN